MGVVYKARQQGLNRMVAVKMIRSDETATALDKSRFQTEAEAAATLHHPNIVQIFDFGEHEGRPFVVLELVEGGTLARALERTELAAVDAAALVQTLARAISQAHQRGIVHRDLKPSNILLTRGFSNEGKVDEASPGPPPWHPKIGDFGLAKWFDAAISGGRSGSSEPTQTGAILGTPGYMAPEQAEGNPGQVGPATDVHALGAILYEMLARRPPYVGGSWLETLERIRTHQPPSPRKFNSSVPRDLETICMKCIEKEPTRRYASALELAEDLRRFGAGEPVAARPVGSAVKCLRWAKKRPAVALSALVAFAAVLAFVGVWVVSDVRVRSAYRLASDRGRQSEENFQSAFEAVKQIIHRVNDQRLVRTPESEVLRNDMLQDALAFVERLARRRGPSTDKSVLREWATCAFASCDYPKPSFTKRPCRKRVQGSDCHPRTAGSSAVVGTCGLGEPRRH